MPQLTSVTLIPGDGIGPEVITAACLCIDALKVNIQWDIALAGQPALEKYNTLLPQQTLNSIRKNKIAFKGPIITPIGSGFRSINFAIRKALDLFVCLRPAYYIRGIPLTRKEVDILVVRENSEDLYSGVEFYQGKDDTKKVISLVKDILDLKIKEDSAISLKPISVSASRRIVRYAFELARKENRKRVTCVHKANIMKATDGLFLNIFREVACDYSDIVSEDIIVDNVCMQLVRRPQRFDILVLPNLYGDIVSDLCAGLIGGLGVAPGANIGDEYAVFEPVGGAAPKYAGKDKANPTAAILSGTMMLKYMGEVAAADLLKRAVFEVIEEIGRAHV